VIVAHPVAARHVAAVDQDGEPERLGRLEERPELVGVEVTGALLRAVAYDPARRRVFDVGARVAVGCEAASLRPLAAANSTG
jgi:hypothetical protein